MQGLFLQLVAILSIFLGVSESFGKESLTQPLPEKVQFNRDIRPILSENCFQCHGPDENQRKADLRFDEQESAFADLGGYRAIEPGKPKKSELFKRITASEPRLLMPPRKIDKKLTPYQVALIQRWIEQGATWQKHWSLIPPTRPELPILQTLDAGNNEVDLFIRRRLEREKLQPATDAEPRTLIRRLYFDLLGLPPTQEEVDQFEQEAKTNLDSAVDRLVNRLLASPRFGERMAIYWLDVVRYADTNGIHGDNHRDIALYRDYVINAFNRNKPFDQFALEQLAGDLLPNPTREQRIASGHNRLLMTTREGGAQAKEYRAKYAADRVRNTSTIWLGVTLGCAECHDHKFDPFTAKDFYSFAAFFSDIQETPVGQQPTVMFPDDEQKQQLQQYNQQIQSIQKVLNQSTTAIEDAQVKWEFEILERLGKNDKPETVLKRKDLINILEIEPEKRTEAQSKKLADYYRSITPLLNKERKQLAKIQKEKSQFEKTIPRTLVSNSVKPRMTRILPRGNWLDDSGDIVKPSPPAALPTVKSEKKQFNRLDLAHWMTQKDNPLFARVFVNRLWKLFYGQGIVKTLDDFGSQGTWPTHPELLDWLAIEFRASGWNVKHMIRLMVTAKTYRQSSRVTPELRELDPYNKLLARQSRYRLDAEMIRDNALAVSGLLVQRAGGRSVKPYQPAGYWAHLNFPRRSWKRDTGENLYRRGVYTYWCRTFLHPGMLAFDAPTREECTVERPRSNTPQQALVLLNDPTYVEAARVLAAKVMRESKSDTMTGIRIAYKAILQREPRQLELQLLTALYQKHLVSYQKDAQSAKELLSVGEMANPQDLNESELAAWTSVTRTLLNLHETISRN